MSIIVMVDSAANVSRNILKKYNLTVLPYNVHFGKDKCYKDVMDIKSQKDLIQRMNEYGTIPKINRMGMDDLESFFRKYIDMGDDILYICVSSKLSNSYKEISRVAEKFDNSNIQIIDSLNIGSGEILLAMYAREYLDKGYGLKQTCKYLCERRKSIKSIYSIGEPSFLYGENQLRLAFSNIPVVEINDGKMFLTFNAKEDEIAFQVLKNKIYDYSKKIVLSHVVVSYSGNRTLATKLKNYIYKVFGEVDVDIVENSSIVFLNSGMNTISLAFMIH